MTMFLLALGAWAAFGTLLIVVLFVLTVYENRTGRYAKNLLARDEESWKHSLSVEVCEELYSLPAADRDER